MKEKNVENGGNYISNFLNLNKQNQITEIKLNRLNNESGKSPFNFLDSYNINNRIPNKIIAFKPVLINSTPTYNLETNNFQIPKNSNNNFDSLNNNDIKQIPFSNEIRFSFKKK